MKLPTHTHALHQHHGTSPAVSRLPRNGRDLPAPVAAPSGQTARQSDRGQRTHGSREVFSACGYCTVVYHREMQGGEGGAVLTPLELSRHDHHLNEDVRVGHRGGDARPHRLVVRVQPACPHLQRSSRQCGGDRGTPAQNEERGDTSFMSAKYSMSLTQICAWRI